MKAWLSAGGGASSGLVVEDAETGEVVCAQAADTPRPLASNTKLFTTSAALAKLGPETTIATKLLTDGAIEALLTAGTYKLSRLITKDRVMAFARAPFTRYQGEADRPSEVSEEARGEGIQLAIGELLVCPYCISQWVGAGLLAAYMREPDVTRSAAMLLTIVAGSDFLHQAWAAVDKRA